MRDEHARAVRQPVGDAVRLRLQRPGDLHLLGAEPDLIAHFQLQPFEQRRIDHGPVAQRLLQRLAAFDLDCADQRIGCVDALQFAQRLIGAVRPPRHGAHGGRLAHPPERIDDGAFIAHGANVRARQRRVAAEDGFALALEAGTQRIRHGADAGDHHDAERHAGDENAKAGEARAQLAGGDAEQQRQPPLAVAWRR